MYESKALYACFIFDFLQDNSSKKMLFLNRIHYVDYLQHCYSFSKSLLTSAQFNENQGGGAMLLTCLSPSGSAATTKTPGNPYRSQPGENVHQKQAGKPWATTRGESVTCLCHFKDIKSHRPNPDCTDIDLSGTDSVFIGQTETGKDVPSCSRFHLPSNNWRRSAERFSRIWPGCPGAPVKC